MNPKAISAVALAVALVAASVSAVVVFNKREAVARAEAAKAESLAAAEKSAARRAQSEEKTALSREETAKAEAVKAEEDRKAKEAERDAERSAAAKAEEDRKAKEAERDAERLAAAKAEEDRKAKEADRDRAEAEADKARALADAEQARARAEQLAVEKRRRDADAMAAEARLYELRMIDFVRIEQELNDYKAELDERERALRPEMTIKDIGGCSKDIMFDENGVPRVVEKVPYLAENDKELPQETRRLAKTERIVAEAGAELEAKTRASVVGRLERLYEAAVKEDRVVEAQHYRDAIKSLYPDWKYGETQRKKEEEKK